MSEKIKRFTDPACRTHDGIDDIEFVQFKASQVFARRGGKAVALFDKYKAADANATSLAGFVESDAVGVTGGHPASVSEGDSLPVNFGENKTCVFPTTGRPAVEADVGKFFDLQVISNVQYINMAATAKSVLTITKVLDEGGLYAAARITPGKRYGAL
jgi:hypothetical protein